MANPIKELQRLGVPKHALDSVSRNFGRIVKGSEGELRTGFMSDYSPEEILKLFEKEVWSKRGDRLNAEFTEIELANRSKFGSRSVAAPWEERKSKTRMYYDYSWFEGELDIPDPSTRTATLRPTSVVNAAMSLPNSTNSGLPFMERKSNVRDETISQYDEQISMDYPAVLGTRTQEGGKTRDVFMWPFAYNIREATFYRPYLDSVAKSLPWRSILSGPDQTDKAVTAMVLMAQRDSASELVSVDFSSYDQSIGPALQRAAFDYVARHFQSSYKEQIATVRDTFTSIGLLTPDGTWTGSHGVPSGSVWTNEIDSIVQYLVSGMRSGHDLFQIQGDDGVYLVNDGDELLEKFSSKQLLINKDKSHRSHNSCVYLQKYYSPEYFRRDLGYIGGLYSSYRALTRLTFLERWKDFDNLEMPPGDYQTLRAISILENCRYNPLFVDFVRFVKKYDTRSLVFASSSVPTYARERATDRGGLAHQYGDGKIQDFHVVKLLRTLA